MKRKWFHMADNTVLDCPLVDYKLNRDTYLIEKKVFWGISILGLVTFSIIIILSNNSTVQTMVASFLGGILSLIVWLFTIHQQDKINYEVANIDMHIALIDECLSYMHEKTVFINPEEYNIAQADSENIIYRFMHLFQLAINLYSKEKIDTSELRLKYSDNQEYSLSEYIQKCDELCQMQFANMLILQDKWEKIIAWNLYTIDRHLNELKKKLCRYKSYIYCGNAPQKIAKHQQKQ